MRAVRSLVAMLTAGMLLSLVGTAAVADHAWGNYHWARTTSSFTLQSVDSVTSDWQAQYDTALDEWSRSEVLNVGTTSADDRTRTRKQCRAEPGMMRVCNAAYGYNGWLGLATISLDSNRHITAGTAQMNDSYSWYWADHPSERQHVMCQEIGHVFGLGHTSEDGSTQHTCMDYSQSPTSISPNAHDYEQLEAIYGHTDAYNSYAGASSGGGDDGGDGGGDKPCNPKSPKCDSGRMSGRDFGQLVASSDHHEVWVRRGPGGTVTLTHVRLAPR